MANSTANSNLPREIRRVLGALRWRIRAYVWLEGLAVAAIWVGLTFWAALALDYLPVLLGASEMPVVARAVILIAIAVVLGVILYRWILRRTFVELADRSMAVLLERRFGRFDDSLITSVELHGRTGDTLSGEMLDETEQQALAKLRDVRVSRVFNFRPLAFSLLFAVALSGTIGLLYAVDASAFEIGVNRLYLLQDTPWPRRSRIEVVGIQLLRDDAAAEGAQPSVLPFSDRQIKVARGSQLNLVVRADVGPERVVPDVCTIYYRTAEGDRGRVNMTRVGSPRDGFQPYRYDGKPLKGILSSVRFDVVGFDHRVRGHRIEVVDSPLVIDTKLDCEFPSYMVDERLSSWLPRTIDLTPATQLPRGTKFKLRAQSNKDLAQVLIHNPDTDETVKLAPVEGAADSFEYEVDRLDQNLALEVTLLDHDGVMSERPHHIYVISVEDEAPSIELGLRGIGTAVTPDVVVPVHGKVTDDYGVDRSWFDVLVNDGEARQLDFELGDDGKVEARLDFREQRAENAETALKTGDKLTLTAKATDKYDLADAANLGTGEYYQLEVVTADQLLSMLEGRELGLRRRFEQIIDETRRMRDSLVRVRTEGPVAALENASADESDSADEATGEDETADPARAIKRAWSLRLLRSQRAKLQSEKSAQETLGVGLAFGDIREELINNRVDTEDRKSRLQEEISSPLQHIAETMFPELDKRVDALIERMADDVEQLAASGEEVEEVVTLASASVEQTDAILLAMDEVLQQMLDIEDFNELLERVRALITDQERVIGETRKVQKQQLLE